MLREFKWVCALLAPEATVAAHVYNAESTLENRGSFLQVDRGRAPWFLSSIVLSLTISEFIPMHGFLCFRYCN